MEEPKFSYERKSFETKYSPFANVGPHKPYEEMTGSEKKRYNNRNKYIGQILTSNQGYQFEIVDYMSYNDVLIRFLHNNSYKTAELYNLLKGEVAPNNYGKGKYSPFANIGAHKPYNEMNSGEKLKYQAREKYIGQKYYTKQGYEIEVVDYFSYHDVIVRFIQGDFYLKTRMNLVLNGSVINPFCKNKFGGYMGIGPYNCANSKKCYKIWYGMLVRSSNVDNIYIKNRSYVNVTVCDEWLNFQNFASWYYWNLSRLNQEICYEIDKDILQLYQKNKVYSPATCCLVPKEINIAYSSLVCEKSSSMPIGVTEQITNNKKSFDSSSSFGKNRHEVYLGTYKTPEEAFLAYKNAKESYIKQLADYFYSINAILPYVKEAMYNTNIKPFG